MKTKETRTNFINRMMGLDFKSIQGKYSFCNDERRQVLFSLDLKHGENSGLILSPNWSQKGYSHSMKHIEKILNNGYDLLVYKTKSTTKNGVTKIIEYEPLLEKRKLIVGEGGKYLAAPTNIFFTEEISESGKHYFEGTKKNITINAYERNSEARQACINALGCLCNICGFDFESAYGDRGKGFIHVHHIVPLSEIKGDYKINPLKDLITVCPNCHAMLHRNGHTIPPEELLIK
ncbi:MAG: HNH endonuclease [Deltaproteobacteria bacterium]|jgi:5-methylcytosine-specific restriction protein A|nr:HNH endonuclease [Deltaproteobacteria bacterium]